jgi:aspartate racemase
MKMIGMIGGMSWESSLEYYRIVNECVKLKLGGFHSAKCLMYSVDFAVIENQQKEGNWQDAATTLIHAAQGLESGGADFIILCTNTMHKLAGEIQTNINIPFLHIADATGRNIVNAGLKKVGLLGTRFTMEEDFYKDRLRQTHGLDVIIPGVQERQEIHRVIYEELVLGKIKPDSRKKYLATIDQLIRDGAEGIILGCTEIGLLVQSSDVRIPLFDTTRIHAEAAVEFALN